MNISRKYVEGPLEGHSSPQPASEIHVVRRRNAKSEGAGEAGGGCDTSWVDGARPRDKVRKEKQTGRSVSVCGATPHLSQNHVVDLGQGSSRLQFTDLHDFFGQQRLILATGPLYLQCPTLTRSWKRPPVSCKQSGKSAYSASCILILEPMSPDALLLFHASPGSSAKSPHMTAWPSTIVYPFNPQHG